MKIDRDFLTITLSLNPAHSANPEFDVTNLQANTQPLFRIRDNSHFIIDKGILIREVRLSLIKE